MHRFFRLASAIATTTWLVTLVLSMIAFTGEAQADDPPAPTNLCGAAAGAKLGDTCDSSNCQLSPAKTCKNDSLVQNASGGLKCNRTDCEALVPAPITGA